ncbi:hypothetical protein [Oceanibacterium hippocampi]|uniref:Uncharacterized protein n=1 Tax=Oceanibacterium hippocampi TaxID=745714 RepID=A0A1Y5RXZ7_9PROT|nr:hypothetical protein [Oceanibacterium hippocampi]SLN28154.1 hypothetical protein OCH7691_00935 [Oceanibacterium hippocampi]
MLADPEAEISRLARLDAMLRDAIASCREGDEAFDLTLLLLERARRAGAGRLPHALLRASFLDATVRAIVTALIDDPAFRLFLGQGEQPPTARVAYRLLLARCGAGRLGDVVADPRLLFRLLAIQDAFLIQGMPGDRPEPPDDGARAARIVPLRESAPAAGTAAEDPTVRRAGDRKRRGCR